MAEFFSRLDCARCSRVQESCCSYGHPPLTLKDIKRIEKLGFKRIDFAEALDFEYSNNDLKNEPAWWIKSMVKINGRFFKAAVKKNGSYCLFLKNGAGCSLGKNRPVICQMYPFWMENGKLTFNDFDCLMVKNNLSIKELLKIMGESGKKIKAKFIEFKMDAVKNHKKHEKIVLALLERNALLEKN